MSNLIVILLCLPYGLALAALAESLWWSPFGGLAECQES